MKTKCIVVLFALLFVFLIGCTAKEYLVTFNNDGIISSSKVLENEKVKKPVDPVEDGYIFLYWEKDNKEFDFNTPITEDIVLNAKYEKIVNKYTVKLVIDEEEIDNFEVDELTKVTKPVDPTKEGYTFLYWELNNEEYDFDSIINNDITLKAVFEKNKEYYQIKFMVDGEIYKTVDIEKNTKLTEIPTLDKDDCILNYWYWLDKNQSFNFNDIITRNLTLTAKYSSISEGLRKLIVLPTVIGNETVLDNSITYNNENINITWTSDISNILDNNKVICNKTVEVTLTANITYLNKSYKLDYKAIIRDDYDLAIYCYTNNKTVPSNNTLALYYYSKAKEIFSQTITSTMDSFEKEKAIYDYLITTTYNTTVSSYIDTPKSIFEKEKATSLNISKTFEMLLSMQKINVKTYSVSSTPGGKKEEVTEDYYINLININSENYYVDLYYGLINQTKQYDLFNVTTKKINEKYSYDINIEQTTATTYNLEEMMKNLEVIASSFVASLSNTVSNDISLKTNNSKVIITCESNKPSIINNTGKYYNPSVDTEVTLNLRFKYYIYETERIHLITVLKKEMEHMILSRDFTKGTKTNLIIVNDKLELDSNSLKGEYLSEIIETAEFTDMIASWAATSSKVATCQLYVKVRVNGTWSDFITYGKWGQGLQNSCVDQTTSDGLLKLSDDEMIITSSRVANAYQFKIVLNRVALTDESPKVTLVAGALNIKNYTYNCQTAELPDYVYYDVPKLNQNMVPEIGSIICSATTSTMLLKYKGFDFTDKDAQYEHRYIASIVREYNSGIYGNWVYNTVGISSYGVTSYVKRVFSWEELQHHLATVGPVGVSIKGSTGLYTTNGHLIVACGYRIVDGKTYVICNDPNINSRFGNDKEGKPLFVYYEYPLETFMAFSRNVIYVVE